jgi:putative membrane protein
MMYGYGLGSGFGFFGGFFMLIFWVLIIWLIVSLVRGGGHFGKGCCGMGSEGEKKGDSAMDILRQRYAKGEITKEEFEKMKQDLQ